MKLNLSAIEKNPELRSRLKDAAKESVLDFFPNKDPPNEALEYVVAAFCLGESQDEFNTRLQQLFEQDCAPIVHALTAFVESNPEFLAPVEKAAKKQETPPRRQKIVWDSSLNKTAEAEDEKKSQPSKKPVHKDRSVKSAIKMEKPESLKRRTRHGSRERRQSPVRVLNSDRWQPEEEGEMLPEEEERTNIPQLSHPSKLKLTRSRLFESALGSIKQQLKHPKGESEPRSDPKPPSRPKPRPHRNGSSDPVPPQPGPSHPIERGYLPVQQQESILDRIRKPDGSAFEDWELNRTPARGKKRQAEQPAPHQPPAGAPLDLSEVESLKLKIARLEKEVQSVQAPPINYYLPATTPSQDFDRWSVCVKNVHFMANEEVVAAHFHSCSPIVDIHFAKDKLGRPKGFCFIQFAYESCVERALELDQSLLLGRHISVVRKLTRPPVPSHPWPTPTATKTPQPTPAAAQKEEWNNGGADVTGEPQDIKDFAIDTGSQELP